MNRCEGCGLEIANGTDGCQELFDTFRVRELNELASGYRSTRLTIDVYSLQHPERYCVSAKSLAAHLTGVAWALDHGGGERGLQVLQRCAKPPLPAERGQLTIAGLAAASDPDDYMVRLDRWARSVWEAYAPLHQMASDWIAAAVGRG